MSKQNQLRRIAAVLTLTMCVGNCLPAYAAALEEQGDFSVQTETQQAVSSTEQPDVVPTEQPDAVPTEQPDAVPTEQPGAVPTEQPDAVPTEQPGAVPTEQPDAVPTEQPDAVPTEQPQTSQEVQGAVQSDGIVWQDGFENTVEVSNPKVAAYWKDKIAPANWTEIGFLPASKYNINYEVTSADKMEGQNAVHWRSDDAKGKLTIATMLPAGTLDYSKTYLLCMSAKLQDVERAKSYGGFYSRVNVGAKGNIAAVTGPQWYGTTDGWMEYKFTLSNLDEIAQDNSGVLKILIFNEYMTGDVWVDNIRIVEDYELSISESDIVLNEGETHELSLLSNGEPADFPNLKWTSSDPNVATVSEDGIVHALQAGTAQIEANVDDQHTASCTLAVRAPDKEQQYCGSMRQKWSDRLTGNPYWKGEETQPEYKDVLASTDEQVTEILEKLVQGDDKILFSDLNLKKPSNPNSTNTKDSEQFGTAVTRAKTMAIAWASKGSAYYQQPELLEKIIYVLEWNYNHFYNEKLDNKAMFGNWWHWWIGIPQDLATTLILVHDELSNEMLQKQAATLHLFNEDPLYIYRVPGAGGGAAERTGANLADTCLVSILRGVATDDASAIANGVKYFDRIVYLVEDGDGIYADGSFIQHNDLAYTGGYGGTLLGGAEKLLFLVNNTPWQIKTEQCEILYNWIWDGVRPLYADGAIFDMVSGRGVARPSGSDYTRGRGILSSLVLLSESAPEEMKDPLCSFLKSQLMAGAAYLGKDTYYGSMKTFDATMAALAIVNDPSIPADNGEDYAKVFGAMDKTVVHNANFSLGISMASERTARLERGNGENLKPWHQSDGVTFIYNGDPDQFADNFWNTVDPMRLPGITTDHSTWNIKNWYSYFGNGAFNGGSMLGGYGSFAMNYKNYIESDNPDLCAKKSWFAFDDEVVALGTGIKGIDPTRTTETIVDNKKVRDDASNRIVLNGQDYMAGQDTSESLADVSWVWLEGNQTSDHMGYYFPQSEQITLTRETRTGSWKEINSSSGVSDEKITKNYVSIAVPHITDGDDYAYVLLPGKTQAETEQYAKEQSIAILSNIPNVQAVMDSSRKAAGFNFWFADSVKVPSMSFEEIRAETPCSVTLREQDGLLVLGISDPTLKADSVTVRLVGQGLKLTGENSRVNASADSDGITLTVDTRDMLGQTVTATLCSTTAGDQILNKAETFVNSSPTTDDLPIAENLLEELKALNENEVSDAAHLTSLVESLSQMVDDMCAANEAILPLTEVESVNADNVDTVKDLLSVCDSLESQQRQYWTEQQRSEYERVKKLLQDYQNTPVPSPDPTPGPTLGVPEDNSNITRPSEIPATGDNTPLFWTLLLGVVGAVAGSLLCLRKRRE